MSGSDGLIIILVSLLPAVLIAAPLGAIFWFKIPKDQRRFQYHLSEAISLVLVLGCSLLPFWIRIVGMLAVILAPLMLMGSLLGWVLSRYVLKSSLPSAKVSVLFMLAGGLLFPILGAIVCTLLV